MTRDSHKVRGHVFPAIVERLGIASLQANPIHL
jgi:hypothetical protein